MIYTNLADLLIAAGNSVNMQNSLGVKNAVFKDYNGELRPIEIMGHKIPSVEIKFPISVVEGRPVFAGDELYDGYGRLVKAEEAQKFSDTSYLSLKTDGRWYAIKDYSWNPPKPKTVMVELLREDAEFVASGACFFASELGKRAQKAIQKALES